MEHHGRISKEIPITLVDNNLIGVVNYALFLLKNILVESHSKKLLNSMIERIKMSL